MQTQNRHKRGRTESIMKLGIAGLGLIGGSMAKAYKDYAARNQANYEIFAFDTNRSILEFAMLEGTVNGELNESTLPECNLIFIALYP